MLRCWFRTHRLILSLVCQYCGTRVRRRMSLDLVSLNLLDFESQIS
ncbi:hypothetical protein E2C01_095976 [Portunus trituberculatus]|uniref:Uncharacterized protein n=1 Tax=Portunus trituberculatus TaxID=210409 RepID=A0A5B7JUF3_PORTR|nr:hypothetical protein [Portunus trituberculatus]